MQTHKTDDTFRRCPNSVAPFPCPGLMHSAWQVFRYHILWPNLWLRLLCTMLHSYAKAVANVSLCVCVWVVVSVYPPLAVSVSFCEFYVAAFGTAVCISRMKFSTTNERHRHKHKHRQRDRQTEQDSESTRKLVSPAKFEHKAWRGEQHKLQSIKSMRSWNSKFIQNNSQGKRDFARTLHTDCAAERYKRTDTDTTDTGMDTLGQLLSHAPNGYAP